MITCKSYTKKEGFLENNDIFDFGFKHINREKIDNFKLFGCERDELHEKDKLFNFWSNRFLDKEIEKRDVRIAGWYFMTLFKRNNFSKNQSISL